MAKNMRTLSGLYSRHKSFNVEQCAYCEDVIDRYSVQYLPTLTEASTLDIDAYVAHGGELVTIPCCAECDAQLRKLKPKSYDEGLAYIYDRLGSQIDKRKALWTQKEIDALGDTLRSVVAGHALETRRLIARHRDVESVVLNRSTYLA